MAVTNKNNLFVAYKDSTIKKWDMKAGKILATIENEPKSQINSIALTTDDRYLIAGCDDQTIKVWELASLTCVHTFKNAHKSAVLSIALSPDNHTLYSTSEASIKKWDL